jgi:Lon protease-like protein
MSEILHIPLFPLHTVLFPGGPLPLRIFEARYLDMVSRCLRDNSGFGVCLIKEGKETGAPALTFEVGTLSYITSWDQRDDGLLGIEALGRQRFEILSRSVRHDHLIEAEVRLIPNEAPAPLPAKYQPLVDLLRTFINQIGAPYSRLPDDYGNAAWVGNRLAELLPMVHFQRQYLLELQDPLERLAGIEEVFQALGVSL